MITTKRFNGLAIAAFVHELAYSVDTNNVDLELLTDWRSALEGRYEFTDTQRRWLDSMDVRDEAMVLKLIKETIASKGAERLVVATIPNHGEPGGVFHELRKESVLETPDNMRANLVIAHCDAHCQNWGWGPG